MARMVIHGRKCIYVGDEYCLGGVLWKHRRLLTAEYVTNNFSRRYTTQQCQIQQAIRSKIPYGQPEVLTGNQPYNNYWIATQPTL